MCACQQDNIWGIKLTRHRRGHSTAQGRNSCHGNLLVAILVWAGVSGSNHVGLEQSALQVDVVVGQGLVDSSQDLLSDVLAALQVVVTIRENLRLDDGDDAVLRKDKMSQKDCVIKSRNHILWLIMLQYKLLKFLSTVQKYLHILTCSEVSEALTL